MPPMSAPPHLGMMGVPRGHDYNTPNLHDMGIVKTEPAFDHPPARCNGAMNERGLDHEERVLKERWRKITLTYSCLVRPNLATPNKKREKRDSIA
eukprot:sb/3479292/